MLRLVSPKLATRANEGHVQASVESVEVERRDWTFPSGSVRVPTDQPLGDIVVLLLEPQSNESFFAWGMFPEVMSRVEYIEPYAIAPLAERMLAADPALWDYRHAKLVAANRLGDARAGNKDNAGALTAFATMAEVAHALSAEDSYNVSAAWDYALAMVRLGDQKLALQDYPGARADFEIGVQMREWLAGKDTAALQPQRDLAYALQKLADTYYYEQNYDAGRPLEERALGILRWVDSQEPGQQWNIIDLATALDRTASYYGDPLPYFRESLALLEGLQAQGQLPDSYLSWIDNYRNKLGGN